MAVLTTQLAIPVDVPGAPDSHLQAYFYRASAPRRGVLQVLVHGNSYDHRYWDAGVVNGSNYSYADYMCERGFDLLAIDLPGVGHSSKPDGHLITLKIAGHTLSDLIEAARAGRIPHLHDRFDHVSSVGHSLGSMVGVFAESRWPAADSLVILGTGFYSGRATDGWAPGARERLLGQPYTLLPPEHRLKFYYLPNTDPQMIDYDNGVLRTRMPSRLWADTIELRSSPNPGAAQVTCPVYIQLGDQDPIMFGEYAEQEGACYTGSPSVRVERLADMGHCFNLHLNRHASWERIATALTFSPETGGVPLT